MRKEKTKSPKPKLKTSRRILELADQWYYKNGELRKIFDEYAEYRDNPNSKDFKQVVNLISNRVPVIKKEMELLATELNKEKFKAALGEDLDFCEKNAIAGDRNSWLKLLRWKIEYLEHEQLRALIYEAYKKQDIRFLEEVGKIISQPLKPHGKTDMKRFDSILKHYDISKSNKENLDEIYTKLPEIELSDKYFRRIGLKRGR